MFNPLTRVPLVLKEGFRLMSGNLPDLIGVYSDGSRFDIYFNKSKNSAEVVHNIEGSIDESIGVLNFKGVQKPNDIKFTATYIDSCVGKDQTPNTLHFKASGDGEIMQGLSTSQELLTYNFKTGYGMIHHIDKPFLIGKPELIFKLKKEIASLPIIDVYQKVSYVH